MIYTWPTSKQRWKFALKRVSDMSNEEDEKKLCPECDKDMDISITEWLTSPIGSSFYYRCKCGYKEKVKE